MKKTVLIILIINLILVFNNIVYAKYDYAIEAYNSKNWKSAREICENGSDGKCLNLLGIMYLKGLGVKADNSKSLSFFSRAEKTGNKKAMINLAIIYMKGMGVDIDLEKAAKYFKKANKDINSYKDSDNLNNEYTSSLVLEKLSNNNIIAEYNLFYSTYLKFKTLEQLNIENKQINKELIIKIEQKYKEIKDDLLKVDLDIESINSKINEDQKIILLLYSLEFKENKNKFETELNNVISYILSFNFD